VDRRRLGLTLVLAAAVVLAVVTSPPGQRLFARTPAKPPARPSVTAGPAVSEPAPVPTITRTEVTAWRIGRAEPHRDPFFTAAEERALAARPAAPTRVAPAPPPMAPPPTHAVTMVLLGGGTRVAAIDGRLVSEGEMIGDERVVEIRSRGVVLERDGHRRLIEIGGPAASLVRGHGR
jgi:hypothetical protein